MSSGVLSGFFLCAASHWKGMVAPAITTVQSVDIRWPAGWWAVTRTVAATTSVAAPALLACIGGVEGF